LALAVAAAMTADQILAALVCSRAGCECARAARKGSGDTHCPAHADGKPSLSVSERSGTVLVHCQSGCSQEAVIAALRDRGLWGPPPSTNGHIASHPVVPTRTTDYQIKDSTGRLLAVHRRIERAGGKSFTWLGPDGSTGLNGTRSVELSLYRSESLPNLAESAPVVLVEGEKCADALAAVLGPKVGVLATVTGAAACPSDEVLSVLAGRRVVLWPDADQPGRQHMERIAEALQRIGAAEVKVVDWSDPPAHGDAADFLIDHGREDLLGLLRGAQKAQKAQKGSVGTADPPLNALNALNAHPREWPEPLDEAAFHGLAGEFVKTVEPYTEADPAALLVTFLVEFASAVGNGPHVMVGATRHPARLSAVIVGQSAKARKGDSHKPPSTVIREADPSWGGRIQQGLSSGEGVIAAVRDAVTKPDPKTGELVIVDEGMADKRLLALAPEFGRVLRVMGRDGNTLSAVIREAWDDGDLRVMTKTQTVATGAHVALLGHVTLEELRRELQDTDAASGFANRFLWVAARRARLLPDPPAFQGDVVAGLSAKVARALAFARNIGAVRRDAEASELWAALYADLSRDRPGLAGAVLGRHEAQAVRLSLVYALLDRSPVVRAEHLEAAVAVLDYVAASVTYIFGDALGDSVADRILQALREGEALSRTQIFSDLFGRHTPQGRIESALRLLAVLGLAHVETRATEGRPVEVWFAAPEPAQKAQEAQKVGVMSDD
jgi:hypothetical protein